MIFNRIQSGYCSQKLGREKEAMANYSKVLKNKPPEVDLIAVTSNNILCINKDQNIFDSKKRVKAMRAEGADAKLTRAQRRDMHLNQCLFYLLTGQVQTNYVALHKTCIIYYCYVTFTKLKMFTRRRICAKKLVPLPCLSFRRPTLMFSLFKPHYWLKLKELRQQRHSLVLNLERIKKILWTSICVSYSSSFVM